VLESLRVEKVPGPVEVVLGGRVGEKGGRATSSREVSWKVRRRFLTLGGKEGGEERGESAEGFGETMRREGEGEDLQICFRIHANGRTKRAQVSFKSPS